MAYRNKTYVCFDGDNDMRYYRLMTAWVADDKVSFDFHDAHELTQARDTSTEATIKRSLRERLKNSKLFVVLIGESTKNLYKFVRWEIEVAMEMDIPIIGVNLDGSKVKTDKCPPILRDHLVVYVPFRQKILEHAIDTWPDEYRNLKREGHTGARNYFDDIYKKLGI